MAPLRVLDWTVSHGFFAVDIVSAKLPRRRREEDTVIMAVEGGTALYWYSNNRARGLSPHMTLLRTRVGVLLGTCSCVLAPGLGAV